MKTAQELEEKLTELVNRHAITREGYSRKYPMRHFHAGLFSDEEKQYLKEVGELAKETYAFVMTNHITKGEFAAELEKKKCVKDKAERIYTLLISSYRPNEVHLSEVLALIDDLAADVSSPAHDDK